MNAKRLLSAFLVVIAILALVYSFVQLVPSDSSKTADEVSGVLELPRPTVEAESDDVEGQLGQPAAGIQADDSGGAEASEPCLRAQFVYQGGDSIVIEAPEGELVEFCFVVKNTGSCDWGGEGVYNDGPYSAVRVGCGAERGDNNLQVFSNEHRRQMFPISFAESKKDGTYMYAEDPTNPGWIQVGTESLSHFLLRWKALGDLPVGEAKEVCLKIWAPNNVGNEPSLEMNLRVFIDTQTQGAAAKPNQRPDPSNSNELWAHGVAEGHIHLTVVWLTDGEEAKPRPTPAPVVGGGEDPSESKVPTEPTETETTLKKEFDWTYFGAVTVPFILAVLLVYWGIDRWQGEKLGKSENLAWVVDVIQVSLSFVVILAYLSGVSHLAGLNMGDWGVFERINAFMIGKEPFLHYVTPFLLILTIITLLVLWERSTNPIVYQRGEGSIKHKTMNGWQLLITFLLSFIVLFCFAAMGMGFISWLL